MSQDDGRTLKINGVRLNRYSPYKNVECSDARSYCPLKHTGIQKTRFQQYYVLPLYITPALSRIKQLEMTKQTLALRPCHSGEFKRVCFDKYNGQKAQIQYLVLNPDPHHEDQ